MGAVASQQSDLPGTMKLFVVLAFVAAAVAEPEADPYLVYSNLGYTGYPYPYAPYTRSLLPYSFPYHTYAGLHHLGKREAEPAAEPEATADADADADAYYGYGLGYGLGYAGHYGYAAPLGYAGHYGYSYYRGKREAEAEPKPYVAYVSPYTAYTGYPYSHVGYSAYPYAYGYTGYPYAFGF